MDLPEHPGLKVGDVVTEIGTTPVRDSSDLRNKIGQLRVGEAVELKVLRDGRSIPLRATLTAREEGRYAELFVYDDKARVFSVAAMK